MDNATIVSLALFSTVAAFTPGPNNLMLAASGVNYGFQRTIPHITGVTVGFMLLVLAAGLGLSSVFALMPQLYGIMRLLSFCFLFYIAYKIAMAGPIEDSQSTKPLSFGTAFAFQWVNPKGVTVTLSTITAYTGSSHSPYFDLSVIMVIFTATTIGSTIAWTMAGQMIGRTLKQPRARRIFNFLMAALLIISLLPVILSL
ncbi:MAG: LysE family translocator [Candidatus Puniceispirillaceae bacterium]